MNDQHAPFVLIGDDDIDDQELLAGAFLSLHPEVLAAIQKEPRYQGIPKIVWGTSDNPEFTERCYRYGAERYFANPSNPGCRSGE